MAHFTKSLDVKQGFNFDKDKQEKVGFLLSMKVGDNGELTADLQQLTDPANPTEKSVNAVAVLSSFDWNTGATDAIYLTGQVSSGNRQKLSELLLQSRTNIEVTFKYAIYEYDPRSKKFFQSSTTESELKGVVEKNGSDLNLDVADDPSSEVQSPQNYSFRAGIKPFPEPQEITLAVGETLKVQKQWGIKEEGA
jgi:hypothetical protein